MSYIPTEWKDLPDITTPITAQRLNKIEQAIANILLEAHPIGSYYWSSDNTDPATLFGGTWVQVKDKFILAAGDKYSAGKTGGNEKHSHTQASTTGSTTLTAAQSGVPAHNHNVTINRSDPQYKGLTGGGLVYSNGQILTTPNTGYTETIATANNTAKNATQGHTHTLGSTNSASNMPPYEVAYCWKRTA